MRVWGKVPSGGHNLLDLWDIIKSEIIDNMIYSEGFIEQVKEHKEDFIQYNLDDIKYSEIRSIIKELQEANQRGAEVNPNKK